MRRVETQLVECPSRLGLCLAERLSSFGAGDRKLVSRLVEDSEEITPLKAATG